MNNMITISKHKNFILFHILLSTLLSIIGIVAGASALKLEQYNNPFLCILFVSNICWFVFSLLHRDQKQDDAVEKETNEDTTGEKTNKKSYFNLYKILCMLIKIFMVLLFTIIMTILLVDISMGLIILIKIFAAYSGS